MADRPERTVRVRTREGRVLPLPSEIVRNSSTFVCTPETEIEVLLDHRFTRKRLDAGDLEIVDGDAAALGLPEVRVEGAVPPPDDEEPTVERGLLGSIFHRGDRKE